MDAIDIHWVELVAGLAVGVVSAGIILGLRLFALERENARLGAELGAGNTARESMDSQFRVSAQEAVRAAHEAFLQLAAENLKKTQADSAHDLDKRQRAIDEMVKPVAKNLEALGQAIEQVKGTDQALRADLRQLSQETAKLVGALRDPSAQGHWGEFILEGLLEKSGLIRGVHYDTQVAIANADGRQRPDAVIRYQDGFNIVIDAKAPLNEFAQRLSETLSEADHATLVSNVARQVRDHVKKLGQKGYWESMDSPDFTVLFLPSEHLYSMALRADPDIVEFAAQRNVIIASPTLLMSLLRVVGMSWRQVELAKNAQEISERGAELYRRFLTFAGHLEKIRRGLEGAVKGYNEAAGSMERSVLPAARRFRDLQSGAGLKEAEDIDQIDMAPRVLALAADEERERLETERKIA